MHTSPQYTGHIPHVGGPVLADSPNVSINGRPAARVDDMATCHGPPDPRYKNDATPTANQLSHKLGHAMNPSVLYTSSHQVYMTGQPDGEGAATYNNIKIRNEILTNGGSDIYIAGSAKNIPKYLAAYHAGLKSGNLNTAHRVIDEIYGESETTGAGISYSKYYVYYYD